jgi:hypothetical protein
MKVLHEVAHEAASNRFSFRRNLAAAARISVHLLSDPR